MRLVAQPRLTDCRGYQFRFAFVHATLRNSTMKIPSSVSRLGLSGLLLVTAPSAFAITEESLVSWPPTSFGGALVATLVFGLIGIGLAILGFKLFDACIRFNLEKEICENKNIAAAILSAAIIVGICIVVAAAVTG